MNQLVLLLSFSCLLSNCGVTEQTVPPTSNKAFDPEILSVIFKITATDSLPSIELYQKIIGKGFLKKNTLVNDNKTEGCIIATFQDVDKKTIETIILSNPLDKQYEFVNEEGDLQRTNILVTEEYFSLRIQKKSTIAFLTIAVLENGKQQLLESITF